MVDGRHSPPSVRSRTMDAAGGMPAMTAKEKPPINVVGDVGGRIAIMVVCTKQFYLVKTRNKLSFSRFQGRYD